VGARESPAEPEFYGIKNSGDIMPKISEGQFALGSLTVVAVWLFVVLPFLHSTPANALTAEERLADYTLWLERYTAAVAVVTFVLAAATIGLGMVTYWGNQWRDTRILQRAYDGPRGRNRANACGASVFSGAQLRTIRTIRRTWAHSCKACSNWAGSTLAACASTPAGPRAMPPTHANMRRN
jgi:hypothetical protein